MRDYITLIDKEFINFWFLSLNTITEPCLAPPPSDAVSALVFSLALS